MVTNDNYCHNYVDRLRTKLGEVLKRPSCLHCCSASCQANLICNSALLDNSSLILQSVSDIFKIFKCCKNDVMQKIVVNFMRSSNFITIIIINYYYYQGQGDHALVVGLILKGVSFLIICSKMHPRAQNRLNLFNFLFYAKDSWILPLFGKWLRFRAKFKKGDPT